MKKNVLGWEDFLNEKKDSEAKLRNRGDVVFSAGSKNVTDDKDHFPINDKDQARNALARAGQYNEVPDWYTGSLEKLKRKIQKKVKAKYPDIEVTEKKE
jgi:hypothetical protein